MKWSWSSTAKYKDLINTRPLILRSCFKAVGAYEYYKSNVCSRDIWCVLISQRLSVSQLKYNVNIAEDLSLLLLINVILDWAWRLIFDFCSFN